MSNSYVPLPPHTAQVIAIISIFSVCIVVAVTVLYIVGKLKLQSRRTPAEPKPISIEAWLLTAAIGLCLALLISGVARHRDQHSVHVTEVRR